MDGFLEEIIVRRELADNFCYVRHISLCSRTECTVAMLLRSFHTREGINVELCLGWFAV